MESRSEAPPIEEIESARAAVAVTAIEVEAPRELVLDSDLIGVFAFARAEISVVGDHEVAQDSAPDRDPGVRELRATRLESEFVPVRGRLGSVTQPMPPPTSSVET